MTSTNVDASPTTTTTSSNDLMILVTRTRIRDHISFYILASLHWLPIKSRTQFKSLSLTYKAQMELKELIVVYYSTGSLWSQDVGWPPDRKIKWEPEPPVITVLSCGIISSRGGVQRPSLCLRVGLNFVCYKAYSRAGCIINDDQL